MSGWWRPFIKRLGTFAYYKRKGSGGEGRIGIGLFLASYGGLMANNRMFIVCSACGGNKLIAKYYASTRWYFECIPVGGVEAEAIEAGPDALDDWLRRHMHEELDWSAIRGPEHFRIGFESEGLPGDDGGPWPTS